MNADHRGGIHGFSLLCAGSCGGLIPCTRLTQPFRRVTKVPEGFGVPQGLVQVLISPQVKVNEWAVRMLLPANNSLCCDRRSQTRGRLGHT